MKKITITLAALLVFVYTSSAQNCSKYYPMNEGTTLEYTSYNKKGKVEGIMNYSTTQVVNDGPKTTATMVMVLKDGKGKEIYNSDYRYSCTGNVVTIDYESLLPQHMMKQYEGMEMEITGTDIEIPNDLHVGQELPDANVTLKINMNGLNMNTVVDMTHRKVEKKEKVTTPSGTYDCYVIYSENHSKVMMAKQSFPSRVWLAEGVGMVKQESYNKKGTLINSSVLSSFEQ